MILGLAALCAIVLAGGAAVSGAKAGGPAKHVIIILRDQNSSGSANTSSWRSKVASDQAPVVSQLKNDGASNISSTSLVNAVSATVPANATSSIASDSQVAEVVPDVTIPGPSPLHFQGPNPSPGHGGGGNGRQPTPGPCGTPKNPELDPEALTNINATPQQLLGAHADGAGVTVAYIADGIDPSQPDFKRNAAYASPGSPAGSNVITDYEDFSGDGPNAPTPGGEAFLDASSIAAQGNTAYDLSTYVNPAHALPKGCDIKIVGAAPGANVMALKVFAENDDTTLSGFLQAINYAVTHGVKVINESFGSNAFPDDSAALDVQKQADDAAVAAGVTVVVSTGDAGITSTNGSPATDPNVISVGASTTFRAYGQETFGGINDPHWNGKYLDNNISSLSSGGYNQQDGATLDLVAPGDENWTECSTSPEFSECGNWNGGTSNFTVSGGTSESSPLTAGAAADVIEAYASTHHGVDPAPALVKEILMSTATDIDAPGTQQGAGLLNVLAAVNMAKSMGAPNLDGGLLVTTNSPTNQINVTQNPGQTSSQTIKLTNTSARPDVVTVSTRALNHKVADQTGSFCYQPGTPTASCPANTGTFQIWSGVTEVYEEQSFNVPATHKGRLVFSATYLNSGQSSLSHVALFAPDGTYAGYSLPQGLGDYSEVEVADPQPGKWTAVFFTVQDGSSGTGTSGPVQWDASTWEYGSGDQVQPRLLAILPGHTATTQVQVTSPANPGDSSEQVVISNLLGNTTTVPVTIRTLVPTPGTFNGVLTGGNGRQGAQAQANTYFFDVPAGQKDLDVDVSLANDPDDTLIAYLVDPNGQTVGYSSNQTADPSYNITQTKDASLYRVNPAAGRWSLRLDWLNPVSGNETAEPFTGSIAYNKVQVSSTLPNDPTVVLVPGTTSTYEVTVTNTGSAPEWFDVDPRLNGNEAIDLPNENGGVNATAMTLPRPAGLSFPYYVVPSHTSELNANLVGSVPVNFDSSYFPGDPDLSGTELGNTASLTLDEPEVAPGLWSLNPDEIGPYPAGAPPATASADMNVVTQAFDPAVDSSTGDFWTWIEGATADFSPLEVDPGQTGTIDVYITPQAGNPTSGTLYVDDVTLAGLLGGVELWDADDLAAIPYSYTSAGPGYLAVDLAGDGTGTVSDGTTNGINCPTTCSANEVAGSSVTLTATPSTGSVFAGWSTPSCGLEPTCTVTAGDPQTVTAYFSLGTLPGLQSLLASDNLTGADDLTTDLANVGQGSAACSGLQTFTAAVLQDATASKPPLTLAQAAALTAVANAVQTSDGCSVSTQSATAEQGVLTLSGTVSGLDLTDTTAAGTLQTDLGSIGQALASGTSACQAVAQFATDTAAAQQSGSLTADQAKTLNDASAAIGTSLTC